MYSENSEFEKTADYLVKLTLSALKGGAPPEKPENVSFDEVLKNGKRHNIANIAYEAVRKLKNPPEAEIMSKWLKSYVISFKRDELQQNARKQISALLDRMEIRYAFIQGFPIKELYPCAAYRMMSDIDVTVDKESFDAIEKAFTELGFDSKHNTELNEMSVEKDKLHIEFHADVEDADTAEKTGQLPGVFAHSARKENSFEYVPDNTSVYIHNMLHLVRHSRNSGIGIRRVIDAYYLNHGLNDVDFEYAKDFFARHGVDKEAEKIIRLAGIWFSGGEYSQSDIEFERNVYRSGIHGSTETMLNNKFNRERAEGVRHPKLKLIYDNIFAGKEYIYERHPFAKKHRLPTPLARLHRINCLIFGKENRNKALQRIKIIKNSDIKKG